METRAHILYSGRVQGVGFRYTAKDFASDLGVSGWVKNLPDGRVEILAEGEKKLIEELIRQIDDHFLGYIKNKQIDYGKFSGEFPDFLITH